jgi:hypothetical protein
MQLLTTAPRLISWMVGYALFIGYFSLAVYYFADRDIAYSVSGTLQLLAFLWILIDSWIVNDYFWYNYGPSSFISKEKTSKPFWSKDTAYASAMTRLYVFGPAALFTYFGLIAFPWKEDPIGVLIESYAQFLGTLILRDIFGMFPFHTWMHQKAYHLHKRHHSHTKDINTFNAAEIDFLDVFLENGIGSLLSIVLLPLFGKTFLLPAFILFIWHDTGVHSLNPYSPVLMNPVLDYFLRPTISHNLHHILTNSHYVIIPVHHLIGNGREKDIQLYNEKLNVFLSSIAN